MAEKGAVASGQFLEAVSHAETIRVIEQVVEHKTSVRLAKVEVPDAAVAQEAHPQQHIRDVADALGREEIAVRVVSRAPAFDLIGIAI